MSEILVLSETDVLNLISPRLVIDAVEEAFKAYGHGEVKMPAKMYLDLPEYGGDFRAMPAHISGYAGIKWVNAHPKNAEKGTRTVMATIILNDPATGAPLACMDGTIITNYRTGAAAAIASKYLARKDARSLGLVGAGEQAKTQLMCIGELFDVNEVRVCDVNAQAVERFIAEFPDYTVTECDLEQAVGADIVSTTTPVRNPIVRSEWVKEGTHINAMGADAAGKQEIDSCLLVREDVKVIVDDMEQALHSGEVNVPVSECILSKDKIYGQLSDIVVGRLEGRQANEITVFDSTGLAIQDMFTAKVLYEKALEKGIGVRV